MHCRICWGYRVDRRLTPFSGRVALASLRGQSSADAFTDGHAALIISPLVDLLDRPDGARDRQVLLGDTVTVIDQQGNHSFVQSAKDGYCGWVVSDHLGAPSDATHWISARASHLYTAPKVQARETAALPMGARVCVIGTDGTFARTAFGYVPLVHLAPLSQRPDDPVTVAESLLGAPYLWGGNSSSGIDCSGLVQGAWLACGLPCPADSDQQQTVGDPLAEGATLRRGDLIFWKGHVAMIVDGARLIHANGHTMSVAYEDTAACITRIARQNGGPVTARRRRR